MFDGYTMRPVVLTFCIFFPVLKYDTKVNWKTILVTSVKTIDELT